MAQRATHVFKGHRWFAAMFDTMNRLSGIEAKFLAKYRPQIAGEADGSVLELGAGTGASFPYYKKANHVTATEPDPYMLERAQRRLTELGLTNIEVAQHTAEALPFEDHSFDHVVSMMVFCTVQDPRRALAEVRRVLKPAGTFRFIDHVRFDSGVRGRIQDLLSPLQRWIFAGCNPNRRTLEAITGAGFSIDELKHDALTPLTPVIIGVARPG